MAGICGVVRSKKTEELIIPIEKMMNKLSYSDQQLSRVYKGKSAVIGNVIPIKKEINDRFILNENLGIVCIVDGYIHISPEEIQYVMNNYQIVESLSVYDLLPYLYILYKEDISLHLTGSYNLFILETCSGDWLLTNDRFGYFPLYYYEDNDSFVFASKIESILSAKVLPKTEFDMVSIIEYLNFRYVVSDNTFIKEVKVLPNACFVQCSKGLLKIKKYWHINALYSNTALSEKDSFDLFDSALRESIKRCLPPGDQLINISLTGGWDCRTVLSYILDDHRDRINLYSYGAENSGEVTVPEYISGKENVKYMPFILGEQYIRESFLDNAIKTIELSSGMRHYELAHYTWMTKTLGNLSESILTGNFGDDIFKGGGRLGQMGSLSPILLNWIDNDFSYEIMIKQLRDNEIVKAIDYNQSIDALVSRLEDIRRESQDFPSKSEWFSAFRVEKCLRKWFGNEANSYNDFVYCYSPFIDYDLYKDYCQTIYASYRSNIDSSLVEHNKIKLRSLRLYTDIMLKNYKPLAHYYGIKGYALADTKTLLGKIKIFNRKYLEKKQRNRVGWNVNSAENIFLDLLSKKRVDINNIIDIDRIKKSNTVKAPGLSIGYWLWYISNQHN